MSDTIQRRASYFIGCMSPSCVPVHEEYSRIDHGNGGGGGGEHDKSRRGRKLRRLIRRILNEGKSQMYGKTTKPLTYQYDAVSYSQNFDDCCHRDDMYHSPPPLQYTSRF